METNVFQEFTKALECLPAHLYKTQLIRDHVRHILSYPLNLASSIENNRKTVRYEQRDRTDLAQESAINTSKQVESAIEHLQTLDPSYAIKFREHKDQKLALSSLGAELGRLKSHYNHHAEILYWLTTFETLVAELPLEQQAEKRQQVLKHAEQCFSQKLRFAQATLDALKNG